MDLYGVKVIYKHIVEDEMSSTFFEEQILSVKAESFDDAFDKAEKYAKEYCNEYTNPNGQLVKTYFKTVDCFLAFDEEDGIQEIYSCIKANKSKLTDTEYDNILCDQCSVDEMRILRNEEFNKSEK